MPARLVVLTVSACLLDDDADDGGAVISAKWAAPVDTLKYHYDRPAALRLEADALAGQVLDALNDRLDSEETR
jgi:hypothetical protein